MKASVELKIDNKFEDILNFEKELYLQNYIQKNIIDKIYSYEIIYIVSENEIIGYIFLERPNKMDPFYDLMKGYCKLIILIKYNYRGKKFAKDAIRVLLEDKVLLCGINKIEAMICNSNQASIKLFTGVGFCRGYSKEDHTCYVFSREK